jgi:hypothetical protein
VTQLLRKYLGLIAGVLSALTMAITGIAFVAGSALATGSVGSVGPDDSSGGIFNVLETRQTQVVRGVIYCESVKSAGYSTSSLSGFRQIGLVIGNHSGATNGVYKFGLAVYSDDGGNAGIGLPGRPQTMLAKGTASYDANTASGTVVNAAVTTSYTGSVIVPGYYWLCALQPWSTTNGNQSILSRSASSPYIPTGDNTWVIRSKDSGYTTFTYYPDSFASTMTAHWNETDTSYGDPFTFNIFSESAADITDDLWIN